MAPTIAEQEDPAGISTTTLPSLSNNNNGNSNSVASEIAPQKPEDSSKTLSTLANNHKSTSTTLKSPPQEPEQGNTTTVPLLFNYNNGNISLLIISSRSTL